MAKRRKRIDYCANHQIIENFLLEHMKEKRSWPTRTQIMEGTGLKESCIKNHMGKLKLRSLIPEYRMMTPKVMIGLFSSASRGNPNSVKLWLQVVEDFSEKIRTEDESKQSFSDAEIEKMAEEMLKTRTIGIKGPVNGK